MKLSYTDGCTCTSLIVDGKETADMTAEEMKISIQAMLNREKDTAVLQQIWKSLVESQGEFEDLGHCDQCGDWITKYTLEI